MVGDRVCGVRVGGVLMCTKDRALGVRSQAPQGVDLAHLWIAAGETPHAKRWPRASLHFVSARLGSLSECAIKEQRLALPTHYLFTPIRVGSGNEGSASR